VACAPETAAEVLGVFEREGFAEAKIIGEMTEGPARLRLV